jgi:8-oxo-dGTP pyrophosphatase MutT (NUDIX family)
MRQACVMLVINSDGLILAISRRNNPNKFGLAGGKQESNEQDFQTAVRECFEETSVKVGACTAIYSAVEPKELPDGEDFNTTCFYAITWEGTPKDSEEGTVKWMTAQELTSTEHGAFPTYNAEALKALKGMFPQVKVV